MKEENTTIPLFTPFSDDKFREETLEFKSLLEKFWEDCQKSGVVPQTSVLVENDK